MAYQMSVYYKLISEAGLVYQLIEDRGDRVVVMELTMAPMYPAIAPTSVLPKSELEIYPYSVNVEQISECIYFRLCGELWSAPKDAIPDLDGIPSGKRWESPQHLAEMRLEMLRKNGE